MSMFHAIPLVMTAINLNPVQDDVLSCISIIRDSIADALDTRADAKKASVRLIRRLVHYQSERSQAVSLLVSAGMIWDAEMVLRSFFEANVKIWYLCSLHPDEREAAATEFLEAYRDVQARRRGMRAQPAAGAAAKNDDIFGAAVFAALGNEKVNDFHEGSKKERRSIEQNWSFSVLVEKLYRTSCTRLDFSNVRIMLHAFGMQSHLLHADVTALDLMTDRAGRSVEERTALAQAHLCRIYSDQMSVWAMTSIAIWSTMGEADPAGPTITAKLKAIYDVMKPIRERFAATQEELYRGAE